MCFFYFSKVSINFDLTLSHKFPFSFNVLHFICTVSLDKHFHLRKLLNLLSFSVLFS